MIRQQHPAIITLTEKACKVETHQEAREILRLAAAMDNIAAQWLDDAEQIINK